MHTLSVSFCLRLLLMRAFMCYRKIGIRCAPLLQYRRSGATRRADTLPDWIMSAYGWRSVRWACDLKRYSRAYWRQRSSVEARQLLKIADSNTRAQRMADNKTRVTALAISQNKAIFPCHINAQKNAIPPIKAIIHCHNGYPRNWGLCSSCSSSCILSF